MNTFIELLTTSRGQYELLLEKTREIGAKVSALDTDAIRSYQKELTSLLEKAQHTDQQINELGVTQLNEDNNGYFQDRFKVMCEFLEMNKKVAAQIQSRRVVLQSEYLKIKNGRIGLSGYQNSLPTKVRTFNRSL